jgi:hypothetical protein
MLSSARDAQERARRTAQEHLAAVRERQSGQSHQEKTISKTIELAPVADQSTAYSAGAGPISGFSVTGVAGDGETVAPPAGSTVNDWNIFVSPNNALLEGNIQGILCTAAADRDKNIWVITMKLRSSIAEWEGGGDKRANFLLVRT